MTPIEFYFDPSCPFCWITSRWLLQVAGERNLAINWRQFSLALKNDELKVDKNSTPLLSLHSETHRDAHRVQRVINRAVNKYDASSIELYSEFGIRFHIMEQSFDDDMILEVLDAKKLPHELLAAADDTSIDKKLQAELDTAIEAAGTDIGVPLIVFTDKNGTRRGYFGPVLDELPTSIEESLALWDGLQAVATSPHFFELKRSRTGDPNVFSAARC